MVSLLVNDDIPPKLNLQRGHLSTDASTSTSAEDKKEGEHYPILQIIDEEHDDTTHSNNNSAKNKQARMFEERIRGKHKSILRMSLPKPGARTNSKTKAKHDIRWAVLKASYLPTFYNGSSNRNSSGSVNSIKVGIQYVGDGNDDESQQIKNARWVSNVHPMTKLWNSEHCRMGEVLNVILTGNVHTNRNGNANGHGHTHSNGSTKANGNTKGNGRGKAATSSLATVVIRPFKCLEDTVTGRMEHHLWNEVCDIDFEAHVNDSVSNSTTDNGSVDGNGNMNGRGDDRDHVGNTHSNVVDPKSFIRRNLPSRTIEVPIEDLIVIGKKANRLQNPKEKLKNFETLDNEIAVRYKYNEIVETFEPLNLKQTSKEGKEVGKPLHKVCHRCHSIDQEGKMGQCQSEHCFQIGTNSGKGEGNKWWCGQCIRLLRKKGIFVLRKGEPFYGPCCLGRCDCNDCVQRSMIVDGEKLRKVFVEDCKTLMKKNKSFSMDSSNGEATSHNIFDLTINALDLLPPREFSLPFNLLGNLPTPKLKPHIHTKTSTKRQREHSPKKITTDRRKNASKKKKIDETNAGLNTTSSLPETEEFIPTSARIVPYDPSKKVMRSFNNSAAHAAKSLASMRSGGRKTVSRNTRTVSDDKKSSSRAARANQRRMLKDRWMAGGVKESLSGCEHALRFGKSIIHGWGVFTDEEISAGDLIVEYRGVLIGNCVADRLEVEYEKAKIGSDYMFRIDSGKVCDATHQGCVARFVNASCTPNCHTQILTVNGVKRIAIYAKRHIERGEELSYDYKFEPEYDETKRIPCNCGTSQCRGFMNWDQRYVAIKPPQASKNHK
jgi:hypothetical protein